jgi:hypothetical protein
VKRQTFLPAPFTGAKLNSLTGPENPGIERARPRSRYNALSNETSC